MTQQEGGSVSMYKPSFLSMRNALFILMSYLLFPLITISLLVFCKVTFYRKAGGVNKIFNRYSRSSSLKRINQTAIFVALAIFSIIQTIRFSFYRYLLSKIFLVQASWYDYLIGILFFLLIIAELFVLIQLIGNIFYAWLGASRYRPFSIIPLSGNAPKVAVLIPTCNEKPEVLERSISSASNLNYPNYRVVVIENSLRKEIKQAAHDLASKYNVNIVDVPNRGHKAGALNDGESLLDDDCMYSAVFDADQLISSQILIDLIPILENEPRVAWVQTPQLYESDGSLLSFAISQGTMQSYDNFLEALSVLKGVPCYGTGFIMRRSALQQVGGWDEDEGTRLTEDISTSLALHALGWQSVYIRSAYTLGISPPSLDAFWNQQRRWATGGTHLLF
ncbi:MAG: glycosyltransferase, partial [Cyanobacteria bacterium P01_D01_bin.105]